MVVPFVIVAGAAIGLTAAAIVNREELMYLYECRGEIVDFIKQKRLEYRLRRRLQQRVGASRGGEESAARDGQHYYEPMYDPSLDDDDSDVYTLRDLPRDRRNGMDNRGHRDSTDDISVASHTSYYVTGQSVSAEDGELRRRQPDLYGFHYNDPARSRTNSLTSALSSEPTLMYEPRDSGSEAGWVRPQSPFGSSYSEISTPTMSDINDDNSIYLSDEDNIRRLRAIN
uniref:ARAD1C22726p n=1 Tax=Blastobotrys adeninivorans TaxID=409370 RepID=A0A060T187_BLAAD